MFKDWFKRVVVIKIEPQILTLAADDILVLSYDYCLTDEQIATIKSQVSSKSPLDKHRILLLEGGGKLSILR